MRVRVDLGILALTAAFVVQAGVAHAQEDVRGKAAEDARHAEEARRMSEAKRAADAAVDKKQYVNTDVSREQLGRLMPPSTPAGAKPATSSGAERGRTPH